MLLSLIACALSLQLISAVDVGFNLQYTSQPKTCQREPVFFEKPLPSWLKGTLLRNTMGQYEMGERKLRHVFDGFAKIVAWSFEGENNTYFTTEFLKSNFYTKSKEINDIAPYMLFDSAIPPFSMVERMTALANGIDNTNINIVKVAAKKGEEPTFIAMSDMWETYSFDVHTLDTLAPIDAPVPGGGSSLYKMIPKQSSAHPVYEYGTDNLITFVGVTNPMPFFKDTIKLVRIKSLYEREMITEFKVKQLPYMHSFALSEHYAVIMEAPIHADIMKILTTGPIDAMVWDKNSPLIMHLIELSTGKRTTLKTDPVFPMHHVNSYEVGNQLIIDYVIYPSFLAAKTFRFEYFLDPVKRQEIEVNSFFYRWTIDLEKHTLTKEDFTNSIAFDLPAINEAYRFKKHCYVYGLSVMADGVHYTNNTLVKKNVCQGNDEKVWYLENHYPTEPWFVASPDATEEDDGILMAIVLDGPKKETYLGIWDPKTMKLINKSPAPFPLPFPLHGRFYDQ